jgi:hypothetical protein
MKDEKDERGLWVGLFIWTAALLFVGSAVVVWHTDQTDTIIFTDGPDGKAEKTGYGSSERATLSAFGVVMMFSFLALLGGILLRVWIY